MAATGGLTLGLEDVSPVAAVGASLPVPSPASTVDAVKVIVDDVKEGASVVEEAAAVEATADVAAEAAVAAAVPLVLSTFVAATDVVAAVVLLIQPSVPVKVGTYVLRRFVPRKVGA